MGTVTIKNVQAIGYISFDLPVGQGGVRLFRGENGAGKTTSLNCLNALLGQKVNLSPSDGAPKGEISGLGVVKTIGKVVRSQGEASVPTFEGRFNFSDLVEPSVKDPAARNKSRIRALVGLTAKQASVADFYEVFGGQAEFERLIIDDEGELDGMTDVLELADWLKRKLQAQARLREVQLESAEMHWQNAVEMSKGHKPDAPPESVAGLAAKYSEAKNAHQRALQAIEQHDRDVAQNVRVEELLAKHEERKPARAPAELIEQLKSTKATVADLEKRLEVARASVAKLQANFDAAVQWENQRLEIEETRVEIKQCLEDPVPLAAAEAAALAALESAEETKQRWEAAVKARKYAEEIKAKRSEAEKMRTLANRTNEVVTTLLPKGPLQVRDGVLSVHHAKRNAWVPYDELSTGERWEAALDVAIPVIGEDGVLPCSQEAWQGLDEPSRKHVAKVCQANKVWLISAEVGDGDLTVTEYTAE